MSGTGPLRRPAGARVDPGPRDPGAPLAADDDALAAIVAALEATLSSRTTPGARPPGWRTSAEHPWRFSGRWWSGPDALRRERPRR
ncbi:MAG: hypothetical protein M0Z33_02540 [Actinomycetota bacterium]|nr:hypothetical protein [Actinomycetota bacterium]